MDRGLNKIAFVVEDLRHDTPGQQLLDRFLIGYPREGEFHRPSSKVHLWTPENAPSEEVSRRAADFGVEREQTIEAAIAAADGVVIVPRHVSAETLISSAIAAAPSESTIFVYGAMADSAQSARRIASDAAAQKILLASGTSTATTWRLPEVDLPQEAKISDALIVVQGEFPLAELHGLNGLLPLLERRAGGEAGVRTVRLLEGAQVWKFLDERRIVRGLLAAALSRSDSPQGLTIRDGRTQNLMAPGLLATLAKGPRAWLIDHADGVHSTLMVLDGAVADYNFAVRAADGQIFSAQVYRPPAPQRHEFSRLAEVIETFFRTWQVPWPVSRGMLTCELLDKFNGLRNGANR
jgi:hypothetical protein